MWLVLKLSPLFNIYLTCIFGDYYYQWEIVDLDIGFLPFCNDIKVCIKDVSRRDNDLQQDQKEHRC